MSFEKLCSAADGVPVAGAKFVLYKGQKVDEANKVGSIPLVRTGLRFLVCSRVNIPWKRSRLLGVIT